MKERFKGSIILLALILLPIWQCGRLGILLLLIGVALLSQVEFLAMLRRMDCHPLFLQVLAWTVLIPVGLWADPSPAMALTIVPLSFLALLLEGVWKNSPVAMLKSVSASFFALIYIPFFLGFAILLLDFDGAIGPMIVAWVVLIAKLSDIGGLFVGKAFGSKLIAAKYSPKKTVEGSMGSVAFALIGSLVFILVINVLSSARWPVPVLAAVTIALSAVSILSDLLESALKRLANVKDSGTLIPGIGGVLDFSDSLLLSFPCAFILLQGVKFFHLWP